MDRQNAPTLAAKLGKTTHLSPLLQKARRLGLDAEKLEAEAVERGCDYYDPGRPRNGPLVSREAFSDMELALALLHPSLRYNPQTIRLGAAMLGSPSNIAADVARAAAMERSEPVIRYVAKAGLAFEPGNKFWRDLLAILPAGEEPKPGVLPHPTRFVAMTGMTRGGRTNLATWIRPTPRKPPNG